MQRGMKRGMPRSNRCSFVVNIPAWHFAVSTACQKEFRVWGFGFRGGKFSPNFGFPQYGLPGTRLRGEA